jgi:hypothetical protein
MVRTHTSQERGDASNAILQPEIEGAVIGGDLDRLLG